MTRRLLFAIVLLGSSCSGGPAVDAGPDLGWPRARPSEVGLDSTVLAALDAEFARGDHRLIDAMFVTRRGQLVYHASYRRDYAAAYGGRDSVSRMYNYYDPAWHPYYRGTGLHTLQSVSKSITSAVYGVAAARGEMPDLDRPVISFFDTTRIANLDERKRRMTVRHLLTMTAGLAWDESTVPYTDPRNDCAVMEASDDWVQYVLDRPMATEPGQTFVYNSGATVLLAAVFGQATGKDLAEYADEHLFKPLGITEWYWKRTPGGVIDAEGGLYLAPQDLARIGLLFLQRGEWEGNRMIPAEWVTESMTPATAGRFGYGYQWWLVPYPDGRRHAWTGLGYGGQHLLVLPDEEIVAVFMGWNIDENPTLSPDAMIARLVEAVE
ncbi:MAG: serine hydrolase [Gemmatimonadales bacterium]